MQLPHLSSKLLVWCDPSERFVLKNKENQVLSVLNRINGHAIRQLNPDKKPLWNRNCINDTPGLVFSGNQRLSIHLPGYYVSSKPLSLTFVTNFDVVTGGIALEVGNSTNPSLVGFGIGFDTGSDLVSPYLFSDSNQGNNVNFEYPLNSKSHVWSILFDFNRLITRLNGRTINETYLPVRKFHFNSLTLGDVSYDSDNELDHFYYKGNIGTVLLYQGNKIHTAAEDYAAMSAGL